MELNCKFLYNELLYSNYTCLIEKANINKPGITIVSVRGTHLDGKTNFDVEALEFRYFIIL